METVKDLSSIEIPTNRVSYNKKSNVLSIQVLDFMFVGIYKKSARISKILDDLYASLGEVQIDRSSIYFVDFVTGSIISESEKLHRLKISRREKIEKKEEKVSEKRKPMRRDKDIFEIEEEPWEAEEEELLADELARVSTVSEDTEYGAMKFEEEKAVEFDDTSKKEVVREKEATKAKKKARSMAPPPPPGAAAPPTPKPAATAPPADTLGGPSAGAPARAEPSIIIPEEPQPIVYEINMGLQYYSVMMEQRSYLFYVYFSHQELKIVDEEGKTVYKTTVKIVTTKEEPPVLDLKIEGEGFEVHPIFGKVEVKKDAVNPPVMIFSIMPIKSKKERKKKKESERRFLNVYIEFEEKIISHTILSIIVQPKYFRLELGPIHLNISKKTAVIISFISILIAGISLAYMLLSVDPSSTFMDYLSGFAPGLGSIVFIVIFLYTLLKEGIYPLKEKISAFLNFDQAGVLIK
ncbi:MAG: hypothetical protein ACFE94_07440 [Candidatus Hodarchaeota archaeon]